MTEITHTETLISTDDESAANVVEQAFNEGWRDREARPGAIFNSRSVMHAAWMASNAREQLHENLARQDQAAKTSDPMRDYLIERNERLKTSDRDGASTSAANSLPGESVTAAPASSNQIFQALGIVEGILELAAKVGDVTLTIEDLKALSTLAQALSSPPGGEQEAARERVARIIEPRAWGVFDQCGKDMDHPYLDQKMVLKEKIETSLTRADLILASPVLDVEDQGAAGGISARAKAHAPTLSQDGKWMPAEPTREMWAAAGDAVVRLQVDGHHHHDKYSEAVYRAMWAAAPQPPESGWRTDMAGETK